LPYNIDLLKTKEKLESKSYLDGIIKLEENLYYNDIKIQKNGKISMPPSNEFVNKFNQILGCIKRKDI